MQQTQQQTGLHQCDLSVHLPLRIVTVTDTQTLVKDCYNTVVAKFDSADAKIKARQFVLTACSTL